MSEVVESRTLHKNSDGTGPLWAVWDLYDDGHVESRHYGNDGHLITTAVTAPGDEGYPTWWAEREAA